MLGRDGRRVLVQRCSKLSAADRGIDRVDRRLRVAQQCSRPLAEVSVEGRGEVGEAIGEGLAPPRRRALGFRGVGFGAAGSSMRPAAPPPRSGRVRCPRPVGSAAAPDLEERGEGAVHGTPAVLRGDVVDEPVAERGHAGSRSKPRCRAARARPAYGRAALEHRSRRARGVEVVVIVSENLSPVRLEVDLGLHEGDRLAQRTHLFEVRSSVSVSS